MKKLLTIFAFALFMAKAFCAPVISNVLVTQTTATTATIQWNTSTPSNSTLKYGTDPSIPYETTTNPALVTSHTAVLTLLSAGPIYYVAAISTDGSGTTQSTAITFSLCGSPLTPVAGTATNYYQYGSYSMTWVPPVGYSQSPTVCGQPVTTTATGNLDGGASFNTQVDDASKIVPGPGHWQITVTDAGNLAPITISAYLSQVTQNVSAQLQAAAATSGLQECLTNTLTSQNWPSSCGGGGGGGGTPAGSPGAIQYNLNNTQFGGVNIAGLVKGNGSTAPSTAVGTLNGTGDYSLPFTNTCTGTGLACPLVGNQYQFNLSGGAGTGAVSPGLFGQMGGYLATGTTISGAPNVFSLNPAWSLQQMNAMFSRFTQSNVASWSITSNVATFQAVNAYNAGDVVDLLNFPASTFFNNQVETVLSSGLSNTQFEVNFTHANGSATETGTASINIPAQIPTSSGVVVIPPGLVDQPSNAFTNQPGVGAEAQVVDTRKGYWWQQSSTYGVKCDVKRFNVTLTAASPTVSVGASFGNVNANGMTMVVGQQVGFGQGGLQEDWEPTVVSGGGTITLTLSANAPFNYSGPAIFGTNNQTAFNTAFKALGGFLPLYLPTGCGGILTDVVRWPGTSLIGQQMSGTPIYGFPGRDILQQQDGLPITAWSINTGTGLTTFTIPSYAAHSALPGDAVLLRNFGTSTFFNNQAATIVSKPTPATFTVANVFGQSTSSSTEAGLAAPTTAANINGLRMESVTFNVNNAIDPSFPWNHYSSVGTMTVEPPMYRPLQTEGPPANNPFGPGWGTGAVNGVANITQNSAVICISTTVVGGNTPRIPATGSKIIFPYQGSGEYIGTVNSTAGSCSSGYTPITLNNPLPNTSAFTSTQAEWFTYTTPQTLAVAIPATISYPYTITGTLPFTPVPGYEGNVAAHGRIIINGDQFDYMGSNFGGTAGGTPTWTLRDGPTSINGGAGSAIGSVIFPINPCNAMYNAPYPVVPNLNSSSQTTPTYAVYYPGLCAGNAAVSFPHADANAWLSTASGLSVSFFSNVAANPTSSNSLGNQNNNGAMFMYQQGANTGYGTTFNNIRENYLWGGFEQGPASVNEFGVASQLPASSGQNMSNCTFRAAYPITMTAFNQGTIDRCDTYTNQTSPYDGTLIGAATWLYLGGVSSEQTGARFEGVGQLTVKDSNGEPDGGNGEEAPPGAVSNCNTCDFPGTIFEGGYNVFGGSYQTLNNTQLSNPVFNYGKDNKFEHVYGLNTGYFQTSYVGDSFYNWGTFSQGECSNGSSGAASTTCFPGAAQGYNGHDISSSTTGNLLHPAENILGGQISPDEFADAGAPEFFDSTELKWARHTECVVSPTAECIYSGFDGFNGYIFIGPHQRIADTTMQLEANVKVPSGSLTFNVLIAAENPESLATCTPNFNLANKTFTATTTWQPIQMQVNFTGYASCVLSVQFYQGLSANTLQTGYFDFFPVQQFSLLPVTTFTVGAACPAGTPNGALIGSNTSATLYICESGLVASISGGGGGGGGTVTSVALSMPSWLAVSGSPVTSAGTLIVGPANSQTSHQVIGTCGSSTIFSPCALVAGDIPALPYLSNVLTTLGDTVYQGSSGAARLAGSTSASPALLVQIGTGSVSAAPAWVVATGTGAPVLATGPALSGPSWTGGATGDTLTLNGPATGIAGLGTATFTLGATAQVGTGATTPVCATGVNCDSLSGTFSFTTGTGSLSTGTIVTVTLPGTRTYVPTCPATIWGGGVVNSIRPLAVNTSGTITIPMVPTVALAASTPYILTFGVCGGI